METIILDTSPEAAKLISVNLWKSLDGNLYNDEKSARYSSCTHRSCEKCGKLSIKIYTLCESCREEESLKKWLEMPELQWDGCSFIYSKTDDKYFINMKELLDYLEEKEEVILNISESLQFVSCKPIYFTEINENYFLDEMDEFQELSNDLLDALDNFNSVIRSQKPVSYCPGKYRIVL